MKKNLLVITLCLLFISITGYTYNLIKGNNQNNNIKISNEINSNNIVQNENKRITTQEQNNNENFLSETNSKPYGKKLKNRENTGTKKEEQDGNRKVAVKNLGYVEQAIINGDTESLKYLLNADNVDVNKIVVKELGYSLLPFSLAVINPKAEIVKIIIDKGADVNVSTLNNGLTPLHIITQRNDIEDPVEIVRVLIKSGANVNKLDAKNRSIIVQAVIKGHVETTKLLIQSGADINVTNSQGYSLMKLAVMQKINTQDEKYEKIINILKKAGLK